MKPSVKPVLLTVAVVIGLALSVPELRSTSADEAESEPVAGGMHSAPTTVDEARSRSQLLHETIHGALQVMHRDFFREDNRVPIPSRSLEDVFAELAETYGVKLRWLAVDAEAMDIDHVPKDEFETNAVKALSGDDEFYESVDADHYRHAGRIRLASQCLKCHVQSRMDTRDRTAALVITMPLKKAE